MKNLTILINQMEFAGAQNVVYELLKKLSKNKYRIKLVMLYDKTNRINKLRKDGIKAFNLNFSKNPINIIKGILQLKKILNTTDILQTFLLYSNIIGPLIAMFSKTKKIVVSVRTINSYRPYIEQLIAKLIINSHMVDKAICVSKGTRKYCENFGIKSNKLITIKNGIDFNKKLKDYEKAKSRKIKINLGINPNKIIIGTIGRLSRMKGQIYLIKALQKIDAELIIIGSGELKNEFEKTIKSLSLDSKVHLLGSKTNIPKFLKIIDIFVFPSLFEGIPNSLLEAMAVGKPIIATDVEGNNELIKHNETGILVKSKSVNEIEKAIFI